jgi:UDP-N-acetylglucosamine acyltransferase
VASVHPTALIESGAELDREVEVGPYAVVGANVRLGAHTTVGSHTVLEGVVEIGTQCKIGPHAVIGGLPQDLKYHGEPTRVVIGDRTQIREFATVHRASTGGNGVTSVGSDCYLMAYSHVAHDCRLEEGVILANQTALGGHVEIGQRAVVSGLTGVHQFVRIGQFAFVGACSGVLQDIPPYLRVQGQPAKPLGLNLVGLRRHGFSPELLHSLKDAYRLLFQSGLNTSQALERMEHELESVAEVRQFIDFIKRSQRGISK